MLFSCENIALYECMHVIIITVCVAAAAAAAAVRDGERDVVIRNKRSCDGSSVLALDLRLGIRTRESGRDGDGSWIDRLWIITASQPASPDKRGSESRERETPFCHQRILAKLIFCQTSVLTMRRLLVSYQLENCSAESERQAADLPLHQPLLGCSDVGGWADV